MSTAAPLLELANDHHRFTLYPDATADLTDVKSGARWHMGPVAIQEESELGPGHVWLRTSRSYCEQYPGRFRGRREGDAVRFTVLGHLGAEVGTFTCRYRLDGAWLEVEIPDVDPGLPTLAFPTAIESEQVLLPLGVGQLLRKSIGKQYSKKAIPQLTGITIHSAVAGNLSWPYQANVMNTLEQHRRMIGAIYGKVISPQGCVNS